MVFLLFLLKFIRFYILFRFRSIKPFFIIYSREGICRRRLIRLVKGNVATEGF